MADIVPPEVRSRMMSGIRGKNTRPEIAIRKELFRRGYRYRIHDKSLPGKPDFVLPRFRAAVFVHGCFWHRHDCRLFKMPSTRVDFWKTKFDRNQENDKKSKDALLASGWRVAIVWECSIKGRSSKGIEAVADELESWLQGTDVNVEVSG